MATEVLQPAVAPTVVAPRFTWTALAPVLVMPPEPRLSVPPFAVKVPLFTAKVPAEKVPPDRLNAASFPAVPSAPLPPLAARVAVPERVVDPPVWVKEPPLLTTVFAVLLLFSVMEPAITKPALVKVPPAATMPPVPELPWPATVMVPEPRFTVLLR